MIRHAGILAITACLTAASSCRAPTRRPPGQPAGADRVTETLQLHVAPGVVDRVEVTGDLPGAPLSLREVAPGRWQRTVRGLMQDRLYRYRFRVHRKDLKRWITVSDPRAWMLDASRDRYGLLRAGWRPPTARRGFTAPRLRDLIIYELCPREFVAPDVPYARPGAEPGARGPGKILRRITRKIRSGYFGRLGVNTLELMPLVATAWTGWRRAVPGRDPWGYLPLSWFALNGDYGSPADLVELVQAAHRRKLSVILDLSLDHGYGGDRHGLITDLWPEWRKANPTNRWGLLELDLSSKEIRRFLVDALERFLAVYGVDGFRMDWSEKVGWRTWSHFVEEARRIKPGALMIAENPVRDHVARAGFDGTWDFFFQWEAPLLLRRVYRNHDGFSGKLVDTQSKLVENLTTWKRGPHAPPGPLVRYIESHDLPRIARPRIRWQHGGDQLLDVDGDGRTPDWLGGGGQAASRLGAALIATVPGAPLIFAGQEFGASDDLRWAYDPLDWKTFNQETFDRYRQVFHLRRRLDVLRSDDLRVLTNDPKRHVLVYSRGHDPDRADDDAVVVALNFGAAALGRVAVTLPAAGPWHDALTGKAVEWIAGRRVNLSLPAAGSVILVKGPAVKYPGRDD